MTNEVELLLYHEAHLLDSGLFQDWLRLLAPDLRYWAPVRADIPRADESAADAARLPLFDETRETLALRIKRIGTGLAWSEIPPTRTRRIVGNVVAEQDGSGHYLVRSNFIVFRSRSPDDQTIMAGCREDRWSHRDNWLLHERKILVDRRTVENMSLFL